ncbi:hypothetical protein Gotur_021920 [Gossypium turneri]
MLIVVSLLGELIWCVQLRNTWPYFVAQRFKSSRRGITNAFLGGT